MKYEYLDAESCWKLEEKINELAVLGAKLISAYAIYLPGIGSKHYAFMEMPQKKGKSDV